MKQLLSSIILLLMIAMSGSLWGFISYQAIFSLLLVVLLLSVILPASFHGIKIFNALIIISFLLFSFVVNSLFSSSGEYLPIVVILVVSVFSVFVVFTLNGKRSVKEILYNVCYFISLYSLLGFLTSNLFSSIYNSVVIDSGEFMTFHNLLYFKSEINILGVAFKRNQGFFWEPGLLQFYSNLLLILAYELKKKSKFVYFSSVLCTVTTFSTAGIFSLFLIIFYYSIHNKKKFNSTKLIMLAALLLGILPIVIYSMYDKFFGEAMASGTYRLFDFLTALDIVKENVLGIGYSNQEYLNIISDTSSRSNTNGLMMIFVYFGLPGGLMYLYLLYKQCIFRDVLIFPVVFIIYVMSEPVALFPISVLFLVSCFFYKVSKNEV